jgi:outer membrane protein assembly factor BamB
MKTGLQAGSPWPTSGGNIRHTGQSPYAGPQTDHLKWSAPVGPNGRVLSLVLDANGNVYVGVRGNFRALDAHLNFLWEFPIDLGLWSPPVLASDGTLYAQGELSQSQLLYAFDTAPTSQNKRLKWPADLHDEHRNAPCVGADGTVYVASTGKGHPPTIYALGPGSVSSDAGYTWALQTTTGGYDYGQPAIGADGTIYVSDSTSLNAIDPQGPQGRLKWSTPISGDPRYGGASTVPVIAPDGTIYIGSYSGLLYAIDPATGISKSRQIMDGMLYSLALSADGTLYVGGRGKDDRLVALTPSAFWGSGAVIWRTGVTVGADSIVLGADGTIYIASGQLHALNPDGSLKWSAAEPLGRYLSEPAIAAGGTLYIADSTSKLYAFGP